MPQDSMTLYKLIVLYMLDRVSFSLTVAQISDFILEREYTTFLTLQQAIGELTDAGLISSETVRNRTHLSVTPEGKDSLAYFENRINPAIRQDIDNYLKQNKFELKNESSVQSSYRYNSLSGEYEAHLAAKDRQTSLAEITLSVPTEEIAASICGNWQKKSQKIYQYLTQELF